MRVQRRGGAQRGLSSWKRRWRFTAGHSLSMMLNTTVSRWLPSASTWWLRSTPSWCAPSLAIARAAGEVEPMGAELDGDAAQRFERVRQQQQLAFGVEPGALHAPRVPGVSDLEAAVPGVDIEVARRPDDVAAGVVACHERHRTLLVAHRQRGRDGARASFRARDAGEPEVVEIAVGRGARERVDVRRIEGFERRERAP